MSVTTQLDILLEVLVIAIRCLYATNRQTDNKIERRILNTINCKWFIALNVKHKTLKNKHSSDLRFHNKFLDKIPKAGSITEKIIN